MEQYGDLEHTTFGLSNQGGASMVTIENTCKHRPDVLDEKQAKDGAFTPTESKVGKIERFPATRRQHDHGSNAKTIFAYGSGEREKAKFTCRNVI